MSSIQYNNVLLLLHVIVALLFYILALHISNKLIEKVCIWVGGIQALMGMMIAIEIGMGWVGE